MVNEVETWVNFYQTENMAFPSEGAIRIFKGSYPRLNLDKTLYHEQKICDLGCGDGSNLVLLNQCGFELYGTEISQEIVDISKENLACIGIEADIRIAFNQSIPFDDEFFDYLLSWNQCYYMGDYDNFDDYVLEFARILKPEGYLVLSIPKKTCFIYKGSEMYRNGYQIIRNDPFNLRNGAILRMFDNEQEIEDVFSKCFKNFAFASVEDDFFGYEYHWHLAVCQKKGDL
jgi:SAM-dependent methyltransferase